MATITGMTAARAQELVGASFVGAAIDPTTHDLTFTRGDGTTDDIGPVGGAAAVLLGSRVNALSTAGTVLTSSSVTGDPNDRFQILADGTLKWGSGSASTAISFQNRLSDLGLFGLVATGPSNFAITVDPTGKVGLGGLSPVVATVGIDNGAQGAATKALTIKAAASQTADLLDILASDGVTKLSHVDSGGSFFANNDIWATGRLLTADARGVLTDKIQSYSGAAVKIQNSDNSGIQVSGGVPAQFLNSSSAGVLSVLSDGALQWSGDTRLRRTAAHTFTFDDGAGGPGFLEVGAGGAIADRPGGGPYLQFYDTVLIASASGTGQVALAAAAGAGSSSDIFQVLASDRSTKLVSVDYQGIVNASRFQVLYGAFTGTLNVTGSGMDVNALGGANLRLYSDAAAPAILARKSVGIGTTGEISASSVPLTVQSAASQTADLLNVLSSDGVTKIFRIDYAGNVAALQLSSSDPHIYGAGGNSTIENTGSQISLYSNGSPLRLQSTSEVQALGYDGTQNFCWSPTGAAASYGGGKGVIFIGNDNLDPSANPVGGGVLYVSGGALKYRGSGGTVTTIAAA